MTIKKETKATKISSSLTCFGSLFTSLTSRKPTNGRKMSGGSEGLAMLDRSYANRCLEKESGGKDVYI